MSTHDRRPSITTQAVEACAVVEQARATLGAQRDTVLGAVVAVIVPTADAAVLRAAAELLVCPALQPDHLLALVEPRRRQLSTAFGGADGDLDAAALSFVRAGLLATREAIVADLDRRRRATHRTAPDSHALDDVVTQRWHPANLADSTVERGDGAENGDADEVCLGLEGALRSVAAELADNARLTRRRVEAEAGLRVLDDAVIADARELVTETLQAWLSTSEGAWRFDEDVAAHVLALDHSALGVLRATRALSAAMRILDALRREQVEPLLQVLPADVGLDVLRRRCARAGILARVAAVHRGWGDIHEADSVWDTVFAVVDDAFIGDSDRDGGFLSVVGREDQLGRTSPLPAHVVQWRSSAVGAVDGGAATSVSLGPSGSTAGSTGSTTGSTGSTSGSTPAEGTTPQRIGRYALLRRLGGGGMGEVFLARQDGPRGFAKQVVVKCIHSSHADDASFISLFQREARVVARLNHHNVITVLDVGVEGGRWFMAVEYLDGVSAQQLLGFGERSPLPLALVSRVILDAAHGLAHAHEHGVVHRDISPDNIVVTGSGRSKVIDFGIASIVGPDDTRRHASGHAGGHDGGYNRGHDGGHDGGHDDSDDGTVLMGKLPYMAPELLAGNPVSPACDVWCLGITLFQLITGRRPFDGPSELATVRRITSEQFDLERLRTESALQYLVASMLDKDPTRRPTAADVAVALEPRAASIVDVADWLSLHDGRDAAVDAPA